MSRSSRALLAVLSLGAGLGACSSDGGGGDDDGRRTETTEATADESSGAGEPVDCEMGRGETITVEIPDFEFAPDPVQVGTCDAIVWSNAHDQAHTSTKSGDTGWSTDTIAAGSQSEPIVFDTPGELTYMCALHPFMTGTVEVS